MSYELFLIPVRHGESVEDALGHLDSAGEQPLPYDEHTEELQRLSAFMRKNHADDLAIDVEAHYLFVSLPYTYRRDQAESIFDDLFTSLRHINDRRLAVFDPQLDRLLKLPADLPLVSEKYQEGLDLLNKASRHDEEV